MDFKDDEKEIAIYGLKRLGMFACSLGVVIVIGMVMNQVWGLLLFLAFFIPLRIFAGGFHLPTLSACAMASAGFIVLVAFVLNTCPYSVVRSDKVFGIFLIAIALIILMAPVDTVNKPLFSKERERFRRISATITLVELFLFFVQFTNEKVKLIIVITVISEAFFLISQTITNYFFKKEDDNGTKKQ